MPKLKPCRDCGRKLRPKANACPWCGTRKPTQRFLLRHPLIGLSAFATVGLAVLSVALVAQTPPVTGDHSSPLRALTGAGNVGVSNAVLREQSEVRALRVVVEPDGTRPIHSHETVQFHLFIPVSGTMQLNLEGAESVDVQPWHPYFLEGGTQHGFHNNSSTAVEIMEIFVN